MKGIERYGHPIVKYRGVGKVALVDGETGYDVNGKFEIAQFASGRLAAGVTPTGKPQNIRIELRSKSEAALSFTGEDLDDWSIKTAGETFFSRIAWSLWPLAAATPSELSFGAEYLEAFRRGATSTGYSKARFLISNMLWHTRSTSEPEPIVLEARDYRITVQPVDDYQDVAERISHGHGVEPTAWVCVESPQSKPKRLSSFSDLIEDVMYLFRLVTGNRVDWYYGEVRSSSGKMAVERIHKYATPTNYSNTMRYKHRRSGHVYLVPKLDLDELVKALFDQSGHEFGTKELKTLINHFATACSDSNSFESTGLVASTLTELIVSKRSEAKQTANIITKNKYKSRVLPALEKTLRSLDLSEGQQREIHEHVVNGYRRSFRRKLHALRDDAGLPLSDCDIDSIVRARNALVPQRRISVECC